MLIILIEKVDFYKNHLLLLQKCSMKKQLKITIIGILSIILVGFLIPQNLKMPVVGAGSNDYNHETFWYEGWGTSIVHKGVDVFAKKGQCPILL